MPITNRQRKLRQDHIGSSDMAAILGVDPWRTAYDVWLEKTGSRSEPVVKGTEKGRILNLKYSQSLFNI